jgi:bacteriorhodopsin
MALSWFKRVNLPTSKAPIGPEPFRNRAKPFRLSAQAGPPGRERQIILSRTIATPVLVLMFSFRSGQSKPGAIVPNLPSPKPAKGGSLSGGQFALLGVLLAILIVTVVWAATVWTSSNGVAMSKHGWIALGLGTFFSLVIGCGLMALMFYSSRSGHDEAATPTFTKPRETPHDDNRPDSSAG